MPLLHFKDGLARSATYNYGLRISSSGVDAKRTEGCSNTARNCDNLDSRPGWSDPVELGMLVYQLCSSETRAKETSGTGWKGTAQKVNGSTPGFAHLRIE